MDDTQIKLEKMNRTVDALLQECELAVMFHETWRPTAHDAELHDRIGTSYAAHAFQIIRLSLRRELLLALSRLWDKNPDAARMNLIAANLRDPILFDALVQSRAQRFRSGSKFASEALRKALTEKRNQILNLINKYSQGGKAFQVWENLKTLRNEHLAHRQIPNTPVVEGGEPYVWATDDEVEALYLDSLEIVSLALSLVQGVGLDFSDTSRVYKHHAKFFWASARGERTEGHPNYRPPMS